MGLLPTGGPRSVSGGLGLSGRDLSGCWATAPADEALRRSFPTPELDDSKWQVVRVPGHWRQEPAFASSDGPFLYRRRFEAERPSAGARVWLAMEGVFYQSDVWLDGSYLGDTEGYFFPHDFEVTELLSSRSEHLLAVEVSCPAGGEAGRALIGSWGDPSCVDPSYNPGGIWAPVRLLQTGPVRATSLRLACTEARSGRAVLVVSAVLDSAQRTSVEVVTEARLVAGTGASDGQPGGVLGPASAVTVKQLPLVAGLNRASWRLEIPSPQLWWPAGAGPQPLYDIAVHVRAGEAESDSRVVRTGLRQVRTRQMAFELNGETLFLQGADLAPTRPDLAAATPEEVARDVELASQAGLNLLRVRSHVGRPELYDAADRAGMLLWQDLPTLGFDRWAGRHQAVRQAQKAVSALGRHPSIVAWCAGGEGPAASRFSSAIRRLPGLAVRAPGSWLAGLNVRHTFERADRSRPAFVHPGTGGLGRLVAGPPNAVTLQRVAAAWPSAVRFVALSAGVADPDDVEGQRHQAELVRSEVETLRRLHSRPVRGFSVERLNDAEPGATCSLLDYERRPKAAWHALAAACSPVLVVASWPAPSYPSGSKVRFDFHVVNDLTVDLEGLTLEARLWWPGGGRRARFAGTAQRSSCSFVGKLVAVLPSSGDDVLPGPLCLELVLRRGGASGGEDRRGEVLATNSYESQVVP